MRHFLIALTTFSAGFAFSGAAWGQSLTGNVGSAGISQGDRSAEWRAGMEDEGNLASRIHFDQAITGWYQVRVTGSFRKPDGQDWDYTGLTIENWFQWSEEAGDTSGFNGGLRLAYGFSDGADPDEIEARLTLTDKFADVWEWRANVIAEIEVGKASDGGTALATRAQLTRALGVNVLGSDNWRFGLEAFSEYGTTRDMPGFEDQAHQIGPVLKVEWESGVYLQTAVRSGITRGADDRMIKLFIGRAF
ncbi:hypothetical protein HHI_10189 [Hyphomonas hirschiana VP5]|nr:MULTISPECIES: hypothetical protein [Hyphomonas]KCZ93049.1 hypothetical protein HHI_10189 [Hyphomonas hirschiana VP5]